jgi:hypothetical protein
VAVCTVSSESEVVVRVDGDLGSAATLIQLHATLSSLAFTSATPVLVDASEATGGSAAVDRLLARMGTVMHHRGVPFRATTAALVTS